MNRVSKTSTMDGTESDGSRPIVQSVTFKESSEALFDAYLDPDAHAKRVGRGTVVISPVAGAEFRIFDGGLRGRNLVIVPKQLIVQMWRASTDKWSNSAPDSLLILAFSDDSRGGRIDLVQVNVPEAARELISDGWKEHYWKPWGGKLEAG